MNNFNQQLQGVNNFMQQRNMSYPYFTSNTNNTTNNIVWVQGIEGAKAWQLNPNSIVILLDSEVEGKMYIKICDNIGMSSLRVFNYKEEESNDNATVNNDLDLSQFVRKGELNNLIKEILNEQTVSTVRESTDSTGGGKYKVTAISKEQS